VNEHPYTDRSINEVATPKLSRRRFLERVVVVSGLLSASSGLLTACSPAPAASPTVAPTKPVEAAQPAAAAKPAPTAQPAATTAPAAGKPTAAGSVVLVVDNEPRTMENWFAYSTYGYPVLRNVEEALINRHPKTSELVGELATRWEQANPTTWRFTLRQGVKFHDGSPFNAEVAAYVTNWTWDKANAFDMRSRLGPEFEAKAVDEYTLDVTTASPDPILPSRLYFSPLVSMKLLKESPDQYPLKAVGTGPYRFVEWVKGQHLKLEVNPDWWGHTASDAYGKATIKDVTFVARPEQDVRAAMLKTGEADFARWLLSDRCREMPQCVVGSSIETVLIRLDTNHPSLSDLRVREAIGLAIDKKSIMDTFIGGGTLARQLGQQGMLGYNPSLEPIPFDPARAKQLIAEAKAAGTPVDAKLHVMSRAGKIPRIQEIAEYVAAGLKQVGLPNIEISIPDAIKYQDTFVEKPIPPERGMVAIHSVGTELLDYSEVVSNYYVINGKDTSYDDPQIDALQKAALPLTGAEREKAYQALAVYVAKNMNMIPICQPNFSFGLSARLQWQSRMDGFILLKEMSLKA
jgi:peptide/nickel transport system substrate-binding protein